MWFFVFIVSSKYSLKFQTALEGRGLTTLAKPSVYGFLTRNEKVEVRGVRSEEDFEAVLEIASRYNAITHTRCYIL